MKKDAQGNRTPKPYTEQKGACSDMRTTLMLLIVALIAQPIAAVAQSNINQDSRGNCSPNIIGGGNVTVVCPGEHGATPPSQLLAGVRVFLGTLPPDGIPVIQYAITNPNFASSITNTTASTWVDLSGTLKRIDVRNIGYIGAGQGRPVERINSPISFGKVVLCLSYQFNQKNSETIYFFESVGEYAKFGPIREMQQFRDPVTNNSNNQNLCQSMPQIALSHLR